MGPRHHYSREGHLVKIKILGCNEGFTNIEFRFQCIIFFQICKFSVFLCIFFVFF